MSIQNEEESKGQNPSSVTRRKFLKNSGYVVGGAILGGIVGNLLGKPVQENNPSHAAEPATDYNQALMFFTIEQFRTVEAATERIFPADELGPGAKDLGVAYFIDHQLSGDWGFNSRDYMQGPFYKGEAVQGYQGRLKRREIFDIALQEMSNYSHSKYQKRFYELTPEQQDEVLTAFQNDEVKITTISPSGFFDTLRTATIQGAYADPLYGGNRNMDGWRMKNFPGNQMAYTDIIENEKFAKIPPKSLKDHVQH